MRVRGLAAFALLLTAIPGCGERRSLMRDIGHGADLASLRARSPALEPPQAFRDIPDGWAWDDRTRRLHRLDIAVREHPTLAALKAACGAEAYACAYPPSVRREGAVCVIHTLSPAVTAPDVHGWLLAHEMAHCKGWSRSHTRIAAAETARIVAALDESAPRMTALTLD